MKYWFFICIFFSTSLWGCSNASNLMLFKKGEIFPYLLSQDNQSQESISLFKKLFKQATGTDIEIIDQDRNYTEQPIIRLMISEDLEQLFRLKREDSILIIEGKNQNQLLQGIQYFFKEFVYPKKGYFIGSSSDLVDKILLPATLNISNEQAYAFIYREPYFPLNSKPAFQQEYNTQYLENEWALWGHNIPKFITVTKEMYAVIDGKLTSEQFNFSSPELEVALKSAVAQSLKNAPEKRYFLIMPNDNELVCQCDLCRKLGNTEKDASPAVINLINKLAKTFPQAQFFTSDYLTTSHPPQTKMLSNTGVMVSTMDFPKGIVLSNSKHAAAIGKKFQQWKEVTPQIFLWDYAVNFDNYMDAYPTLYIQQENLKFYKSLGVTGVFIQGNENGFSAFEDLKTITLANVLQNLDTDISGLIRAYFKEMAGEKTNVISDYVIGINQKAQQSKYPLDIYGGTKQSLRKYLRFDQLSQFYQDLLQVDPQVKPAYREQYVKLKIAVLFQLLEIARTNGLNSYGWGLYDAATYQAKPNEDTLNRLAELKSLVGQAGVDSYNEIGQTFEYYLSQWKSIFLEHPYTNLFFGENYTVKSNLDEDYTDSSMLFDGALGFLDYYNNWMILTKDNLTIDIPITEKIRKGKTIEISFLVDKKHKLDVPQAIELRTENKEILQKSISNSSAERLIKVIYSFPVSLRDNDKTLTLKIIKNKIGGFACDEIMLKN